MSDTTEEVGQEVSAESQEPVESTQTQDDQQSNLEFESGFAEARGEEPPAPVEEKPEEKEEPTEPQPVLAGLTEDQIRNLLAKAGEVDAIKQANEQRLQQAFGKLGELNRTIQQLQQHQSGSAKLDPSKLTRLKESFPELADVIAQDLSDALTTGGGQPAFDPSQIDQLVAEKLANSEQKIEQAMEKRWLKRQHKDWEDVVSSTEFKLWKDNVLPADDRQALESSWDAEYISDRLTAFKDWRDRASKSKETKQKRLEAAVAPTGGRAPPSQPTEDDAFLSGWKAVRGR